MYEVIGNVANMGNLTATSVLLDVTFYDAAGKVLNYDSTGVSPKTIPPRQSADFIIETPLVVYTPISDYSNDTAETHTIASANVTAKSREYLSILEPHSEREIIKIVNQWIICFDSSLVCQ
jgi:hypothetical protein